MREPSEQASLPGEDDSSVSLEPSLDMVINHLYRIVVIPAAKEEDFPAEFAKYPKLRELHTMLWGIRKLAYSMSNGELDYTTRERGFVVGALKSFQSNLRHLTWQSQRIASGEYNHRVNFMGDFSAAFNQMAEQLGSKINTLTHMSEEYKDLSHKDPLTGLYNRNALYLFAERLLGSESGMSLPSTLIMADIDKFKHLNDTYGHLCGDAVLRSFASKLTSLLRPEDICCRYGGEEFVLLLPETPIAAGLNITERIRAAVEENSVTFEDKILRITASFGLSEIGGVPPGMNFQEHLDSRLHVADSNMYKAKQSGRNRVVSESVPMPE